MSKHGTNYARSNKISHNLLPVVEDILSKKSGFFKIVNKHPAPFYVFDQPELDESIERFINAFRGRLLLSTYYALKLNHHSLLVKRVVEKGVGLEVASIRELNIALDAGSKNILYYAPAKDKNDFRYILQHADKVRVHLDSFYELGILGELTNELKIKINAGVRINLPSFGAWTKYGIPISSLKEFWKKSEKYPLVKLNGIHFHQSRNRTTSFYANTIKKIAEYLKINFSPLQLTEIECIDIGGGYEWTQSEGEIVRNEPNWPTYKILKAPTIEEYAQAIEGAIKKYLEPIVQATYITEPGRYICNKAMHIVLKVGHIKNKDECILNGGVNMVGWQRFEHEYFPLVNITSPDNEERRCRMWGNLCTTWDIWGYYYYGKGLSVDDVIVIPYQGALSYSLAQSFINKIPSVYKLKL
jgi:diaminopimelate decarboxylase